MVVWKHVSLHNQCLYDQDRTMCILNVFMLLRILAHLMQVVLLTYDIHFSYIHSEAFICPGGSFIIVMQTKNACSFPFLFLLLGVHTANGNCTLHVKSFTVFAVLLIVLVSVSIVGLFANIVKF